jgi:hypothetical protein
MEVLLQTLFYFIHWNGVLFMPDLANLLANWPDPPGWVNWLAALIGVVAGAPAVANMIRQFWQNYVNTTIKWMGITAIIPLGYVKAVRNRRRQVHMA